MNTARRKRIGAKMRIAGSVSDKLHVASWQGSWIIFKDARKPVLFKFSDKDSAVKKAEEIFKDSDAKALVVHRTDGSVERFQSA